MQLYIFLVAIISPVIVLGHTTSFIERHYAARKNIAHSDTIATLNQDDPNGEIQALIDEAKRLNDKANCNMEHHCVVDGDDPGCSQTVMLRPVNGAPVESAPYGENLFSTSKCGLFFDSPDADGNPGERCVDPERDNGCCHDKDSDADRIYDVAAYEWARERRVFKRAYDNDKSLATSLKIPENSGYGHWTQMVHPAVQHVGCDICDPDPSDTRLTDSELIVRCVYLASHQENTVLFDEAAARGQQDSLLNDDNTDDLGTLPLIIRG